VAEPLSGHVVGEGDYAGPRWPGIPEHQIVRDPQTMTLRCRCSEVSFTEEWLAVAPREYTALARKQLLIHVLTAPDKEGQHVRNA
jgi:hypothetical protein